MPGSLWQQASYFFSLQVSLGFPVFASVDFGDFSCRQRQTEGILRYDTFKNDGPAIPGLDNDSTL